MTAAQDCYDFTNHCFPIQIKFVPNQFGWDALMLELGLPPENIPKSPGMVTQFCLHEAPNIVAITFGPECDTRTSSEVIGLITHELIHVKQYVESCLYENSMGSGDRRLDSESEAYLMQALILWLQGSYAASGRGFDDGQDESKGQLQG